MALNPIRRHRLPLAISSWVTFAVSLAFYWITADPDVSFWDCPEYVTVASKMEVGHSPGNPIWMLAMRIATIPFPSASHAYIINLCSGIFMAFAAFFLCRMSFVPIRLMSEKFSLKGKFTFPQLDLLSGFLAFGASMTFALCDSAWYSAVEAEVYAMSTFLAAAALWVMEIWFFEKDKSKRSRLLILLAYLTGLSLGVHELNLLLIPVFALVVLYGNSPRRIPSWKPAAAILIGCGLLGFILLLFLPLILEAGRQAELFGVNGLGLPYDSGLIGYCIMLIFTGAMALWVTNSRRRKWIKYTNTAIWMGVFLLLGFSSFGMIMIRAKAAPPMNEGNPDNIFSLASYIQREQYPSAPLLYGSTPYSRPMMEESFTKDGAPRYSRYLLDKGKPQYRKVVPGAVTFNRTGLISRQDSLENLKINEQGHGYLLEDYAVKYVFTPELNMWFPRMTSRNTGHREAYAGWTGMNEENMVRTSISETLDSLGNPVTKMNDFGERPPVFSYRPTYLQNLRYFLSYQAYYMYFRYLFWNFIGRQNDYASLGEIDHGNFITGITPLDRAMGVDSEYMPPEIKSENKGYNRYFGIPFVFGIIGMVWLAVKSRFTARLDLIVAVLFLMTGLAIVVYLNQDPGEARERDYSFLISFMAFSMWIGAGLLKVALILINRLIRPLAVTLVCIISICPATLMALENFDDHDRRNRFETTFHASTLLDFEHPAIIFSYGDNTTFPLWYASEVLNMGKGNIPVDITYLSQPNYVENLLKQGDKSIKITYEVPEFLYGKYAYTQLPSLSSSKPMKLNDALEALKDSKNSIPLWPTSLVILPGKNGKESVINLRDFTGGSSLLGFRELMLLQIILEESGSESPRALFFPSSIERKFYQALDSVTLPTLFGRVYYPGLSDSLALEWTKVAIDREINKQEQLEIQSQYNDPMIQDLNARYRGEMIIAAKNLLASGDTIRPIKITEILERKFPYSSIYPGYFLHADTVYYEGREYVSLLYNLGELTGNDHFIEKAEKEDSIIKSRRQQWTKYYNSLSPQQRQTLSNRSKQLLTK